MGLFDFLKSPEQRKQEEQMNKLFKELFPNGDAQLNTEVQHVRDLLEFKYTKESVKQTYLYACAIYYLSDDKDLHEVVGSILRNDKTSVTKEDAIKIYFYLQDKFARDSFAKLADKLNNLSDGYKLFMIAKGGIVELKKAYKDLSDKGKFEVIIFNTLIVLQGYQEKFPLKYDKVSDDLFTHIFNQAREYQITMTNEKLRDFINNRFKFYSDELNEQLINPNHLQTKVFSNFYRQPLAIPSGDDHDLFEYMEFFPAYLGMINWVRQRIENF
ncbi:MAG: hypothetical protein KIT51_04970 [Cyclobacteriaceae bacterium]|nr:MAG: hypothetical protein KIT51_04970 [Cyclobacteriaceae bacterium]